MERNVNLKRHIVLGESDLLFVKMLMVMEEDKWFGL